MHTRQRLVEICGGGLCHSSFSVAALCGLMGWRVGCAGFVTRKAFVNPHFDHAAIPFEYLARNRPQTMKCEMECGKRLFGDIGIFKCITSFPSPFHPSDDPRAGEGAGHTHTYVITPMEPIPHKPPSPTQAVRIRTHFAFFFKVNCFHHIISHNST
jgi:hypothetical protein